MRHAWIYGALMVGIWLGWIGSFTTADALERPVQEFKVPIEAPDFTLKSLNGKNVTLSELKGKVVMINFFTTW